MKRTAATVAARSGDPFAVQRLLGHANLSMATRYVQDVSAQEENMITFSLKRRTAMLTVVMKKMRLRIYDRRIILGAGGGYQWIESDNMNFSSELGLAYVNEKYDTEKDDSLSAQVGYHFDKKLRDNITFINNLTYYPSLEKVSDYYMTTTAEIRANFTSSFFANFKTIFNYDSTPAEGKHNTDVKYFLGLGYSF